MRSWIELLRSETDFPSIVRRWPHAVQTADAVVIPTFRRVSDAASIVAYVTPDAVTLRPLIESRACWQAERDRLIAFIEGELGVPLGEPARCDVGEVQLDEEWGDFAVRVS